MQMNETPETPAERVARWRAAQTPEAIAERREAWQLGANMARKELNRRRSYAADLYFELMASGAVPKFSYREVLEAKYPEDLAEYDEKHKGTS